jgi:hypothetical protein
VGTKRKVVHYASNYLYSNFGEHYTAGRSPFWISKFGCLKILRKIRNRCQPHPRGPLPHHRAHHARPRRRATSCQPPRVPRYMRATAAACLRVLPRCLPCRALLRCRCYLPAYSCGPPLPPLLLTVALLLRHSEKLPPSSLRCPPPRSKNLPQIAHRREEPPEASRGCPSSASVAPHCGQRASDSEPDCRHLPKMGTGTVLLSEPPAKLLESLRRPAPLAYSHPSAPSWRLNPGESPTAPPPQIECPPSRHPPRPAPSTGLAAGCRNRPVPPPLSAMGELPCFCSGLPVHGGRPILVWARPVVAQSAQCTLSITFRFLLI